MDIYYNAESMDMDGSHSSDMSESHPKTSSVDYDLDSMQQQHEHMNISSSSHENQDVTQYVSKVQQAGKYLSQIVHTNECRGHCSNECMTRFRLINHSVSCAYGGSCVIAGCHTTRQLIRHRENCYREEQAARALGIEKRECLICTIAYKYMGSGSYCESASTLSLSKTALTSHQQQQLASTPNTVTSFESPISSRSARHQRLSAPELTSSYARSYSSETGQGSSSSLLHHGHDPRTRHLARSVDDHESKRDHEFAIPTMLPKRFRRASGSDLELVRGVAESTMDSNYYMHTANHSNQAASPPMEHYRDSI